MFVVEAIEIGPYADVWSSLIEIEGVRPTDPV